MASDRFTPGERMVKARIQLLRHQPFFGTIAMRLKLEEMPKGPMNPFGTMATDGRSITFAPEFLNKLTDKQIEGVIAHEVMHVANKHHLRRRRRKPGLWNWSCDATINQDILEAGMELPPEGVMTPEHKGKAAETIYAEMLDKQQDDNGGGEGGDGPQEPGWGNVLDDPEGGTDDASQAEQEAAEQEVNIMVAQAAQAQERHNQAKSKGATPAWMQRLVKEIVAPEVPWQDVLRRFVAQRVPYDQSWSRINRRFAHMGTHLPGVLKEGLGPIAFFFDTSGSISPRELTRFYGESNSIVEELHPERVYALACDSQVGKFVTLEDGESLDPAMFVGGGGSDFRPAFEAIEELDQKPVCAVVFSDMMIDFPAEAPDYPVLLITTTEHRGPDWGDRHIRVRDV